MSASVVDAFLVTMGLDGSLFKKGMKDVEKSQDELNNKTKIINKDREKEEKTLANERKKRDKEHEEHGKKAVEGYKKVRNEVMTLAAVFTAGMGLKDFVTSTIAGAANLGYLSANLRMSTQELTSWQRASERAGGSSEGIVAQLKESAETLAQFRSGMGPNEGLQKFFQWGGKESDLKDGNTYLLARSRIISNLFKQDPAKAALIAKQMGVTEDQFNFIKQGPQAVMDLVRAQEKNASITAKDSEEALKLKNQMLDLRDTLQSTGTRLLVQLIPSLEKLVVWLNKGSQWVADHKEDIAVWVEKCVAAVTRFVEWSDKAATSVGGWQNVLIALIGLKVVGAVAGMVQLAGALLQVGAALGGISGASAAVGVLGRLGAVGLAGAAGYGVGTVINDKFIAGTKAGDMIGAAGAHFMAMLGSQDAKDAIAATEAASRAKRTASGKIKPYGAKDAAPAPGAIDYSTPRGIRNYNPGNINAGAWARDHGATGIEQGKGARFATFATPQAGLNALGDLLRSKTYIGGGNDTVRGIVSKYAPQGDGNDTEAYIKMVTKRMGIKDNDRIDPKNQQQMVSLMDGVIRMENTKNPYSREMLEQAASTHRIADTMDVSDRMKNAQAVAAIPVGAPMSVPAHMTTSSSNSTTEVHIDNINIQTQATDSEGIAKSIRPEVQQYTFATQANTGMR